jgi:hypothetical protein
MLSSPEEAHLDVLQNIESSILSVYQDHPELTDYQVDSALEALGRTYHREKIGGPAVLPKGDLARKVYDAVRLTCEWRLGRQQVVDEEQQPLSIEPISIDDLLEAFKRLRKSVKLWNKEGGSQGYLKYIRQFIP